MRHGIALLACASVLATGCGTVDLGTYEGVRDLKVDENYYYCVIQPKVITPKKCAGGDPGAGDGAGGCHASTSSLRLEDPTEPTPCTGGVPNKTPSSIERSNYAAAALRVRRDVEASPILAKPTKKVDHPREIFNSTSVEADLIRAWIKGAR